MDRLTAEILCSLTDDFYAANAESFSRTRQQAWVGWQRCLEAAGLIGGARDGRQDGFTPTLEDGLFENAEWPLSVIDVACGNLRFARYLRGQLAPERQLEYFAADSCEELLPDEESLANTMPFVRFQKVDVLQRLLHGADLPSAFDTSSAQMVVCFGFMHHVPGMALRADLLDGLVRCARPGGYVIVSFWQFLKSDELAQGARAQHMQALSVLGMEQSCLDDGDFLLGWQNVPVGEKGSIRYCHHFTDEEIDVLVGSVSGRAGLVDRFTADGRTGDLNTYVVLRAC